MKTCYKRRKETSENHHMLPNIFTCSTTPTIRTTNPLLNYNNTFPTLYEDASGGGGGGTAGNTNLLTWVKPCDSCGAAAGSVYCRADAAYLCTTCDAQVHAANRVASRHERVPVCEACEQAPAALACRADAAALCAACDVSVHSANKLAGRHQRIINAVKKNNEQDSEIFNEGNLDEYFDLGDLDSCYEHFGDANYHDRMMMPSHVMAAATSSTGEASTVGYSYTKLMGHSVSLSSLEASVVTGTTITDISNSHLLPTNGTLDLVPGPAHLLNLDLSAVDREARVMRYKEKRKTRKFEKILRYASRKAFAEARPRIKGRFVKRSDMELEVDQMFSQSALLDHRVMRPCYRINDSKKMRESF